MSILKHSILHSPLMTIRWKMPRQTFNDCLSFVIHLLQLKAFSHIMYGMTTKLVIYGIIDFLKNSNDLELDDNY
jgi:hypothetical protein